MCGSETTLVAAARLGGDASPLAIDIAAQRLEAAGFDFASETVPARRAARGR